MIEFLNDSVRNEFHKMPAERQMEFQTAAERFLTLGMVMKILFVDRIDDKISEVAIRIDKKF